MKKTVQILLFLTASLGAFLAYFMLTMPDPNVITTCLTAKMHNVPLCEKESGYVRIQNVSPYMKDVVVISEDSTFYSHAGFDWFEIKNSLMANLREKGYARGGSTITQQLAKNVFLTPEKSILRKLREAYLAFHIERLLPKQKILEKYLNVVELGRGIYGIRQASEYYFAKPPSQLNLLESAFLTYLLPNPKGYSRVYEKGLTEYARFRILDLCYKMYRYGRISEDQYRAAKEYVNEFPWKYLTVAQLARLDGAMIVTDEDFPSDLTDSDVNESNTIIQQVIDDENAIEQAPEVVAPPPFEEDRDEDNEYESSAFDQ